MTLADEGRAGPPLLRPGDVVLGLEIRRLCGAGGFGSVYEAFDPALRRAVALKVLHRRDPAVLRRFRDEGRSLARLSHPRIVQVYAVDVLPDGSPALLMQFVPGGSLADHVPPGVALSPSTAAEIVGDVLEALTAAHAAGICHRDVKPANVLWHPGARSAFLCDFGIARLVDAPPSEPTAGLVGSRQSLAPERLRGIADDPRSDLFAAGALLYRLVAGVDPFDVPGGDLLALAERMTRPPPPPNHVPAGIARLCTALLAYDPAHRPSAADARLMLRAALRLSDTEDAPVAGAALPVQSPDRTSPHGRPRRRALLAGFAAAATLAGGALLLSARGRAPGPAASGPAAPASAHPAELVDAPAAAPSDEPPAVVEGPVAPASAVARPSAGPRSRGPEATPRDRRPRNPGALEQPWVEPSP
jgi:hypothetical protein